MCASSHRELRAWQLADAVRRRVVHLCSRPEVRGDSEFCDQSSRAARSACRNLAEGFARYGHPDFARFVIIAHSSLGELRDGLDEALEKGYIDVPQFEDFDRAIESAMKSSNGLGDTFRTPLRQRNAFNTGRRPAPSTRAPEHPARHRSTQHRTRAQEHPCTTLTRPVTSR